MTRSAPPKPPLWIFIHGAFQASWVWRDAISLLQQGHVAAKALDLPGHGKNQRSHFNITLKTYVDYVVDVIKTLNDEHSIYLVGHSMAGMVISQVAEKVPVTQLIYVTAFLPTKGESLFSITKTFFHKGLGDHMQIDKEQHTVTLYEPGLCQLLFSDCEIERAEQALVKFEAQPLLPFNGMVELGNTFARTPKVYIECTLDKTIPPEIQRQMCQRYPDCLVKTIDTGHEPMWTQPELLVEQFSL